MKMIETVKNLIRRNPNMVTQMQSQSLDAERYFFTSGPSTSRIASAAGVDVPTAYRELLALHKRGLLFKSGNNVECHWYPYGIFAEIRGNRK